MKLLPLLALLFPYKADAQLRAGTSGPAAVTPVSFSVDAVKPAFGTVSFAPGIPALSAVLSAPSYAPALTAPVGAAATPEKPVLPGSAAEVSFDGASAKRPGGFVVPPVVPTKPALRAAELGAPVKTAVPAVSAAAVAPVVGAMTGTGVALAVAFGALAGAMAGLLAAIMVAGFVDAVTKGGLDKGFTWILAGGGVVGALAGAIGAAVSAAAFEGVMFALFAGVYLPLIALAVYRLARRRPR